MQQYFENKGTSPMYVAGTMILPGEGAMVDVPAAPAATATPAEPTLAATVADLLTGSVKVITQALPTLSDDALDMAAVLEEAAAKPRSTLLEALSQEQLRRADATLAKLTAANDAAASAGTGDSFPPAA